MALLGGGGISPSQGNGAWGSGARVRVVEACFVTRCIMAWGSCRRVPASSRKPARDVLVALDALSFLLWSSWIARRGFNEESGEHAGVVLRGCGGCPLSRRDVSLGFGERESTSRGTRKSEVVPGVASLGGSMGRRLGGGVAARWRGSLCGLGRWWSEILWSTLIRCRVCLAPLQRVEVGADGAGPVGALCLGVELVEGRFEGEGLEGGVVRFGKDVG